MSEFVKQFGIDWRLLVSQAVNFFLLLAVLWYVLYKPLLSLLAARKRRIEEGLLKADEAERRLGEVQEIAKEQIGSAEKQALEILRSAEEAAKIRDASLLGITREKGEVLLRQAVGSIEAEREKMRREVYEEAAALVRGAVAKTVEMKPDEIDAALVEKAIKTLTA